MTLTVTAETAGMRLDAFLATAPALSRSAAARLIEEGAVTVNGAPQKPRQIHAPFAPGISSRRFAGSANTAAAGALRRLNFLLTRK